MDYDRSAYTFGSSDNLSANTSLASAMVKCRNCGWYAGGLTDNANLVLVKHTGIFQDVVEPLKSWLGDKTEVIEEYCPKCNSLLDALDMMAGLLDDEIPPDPSDNYCPACDAAHPTKYCGNYWKHAGRGEYDQDD